MSNEPTEAQLNKWQEERAKLRQENAKLKLRIKEANERAVAFLDTWMDKKEKSTKPENFNEAEHSHDRARIKIFCEQTSQELLEMARNTTYDDEGLINLLVDIIKPQIDESQRWLEEYIAKGVLDDRRKQQVDMAKVKLADYKLATFAFAAEMGWEKQVLARLSKLPSGPSLPPQ